ncbi:hypothetical protein [Paraburkholderia franconis]|uniref:hypothetical protein n=1 Tax=Paraburkholderia franconis TaxID=2654983 RepID=UPI0038993F99
MNRMPRGSTNDSGYGSPGVTGTGGGAGTGTGATLNRPSTTRTYNGTSGDTMFQPGNGSQGGQ